MNAENQYIEWKESWRDEYLKWICGFANAEGGKLAVGVNDHGSVVGVINAKDLLETIPNKVKDILGILVDVNLVEINNLQTIEIITEAHPFPVSYKGHYYLRSGSTNQELKGNSLDMFLLRKQGKRWDGVPVPGVKVGDLSSLAFDYFIRKAKTGKRQQFDLSGESSDDLLEKLHLKEGSYIKRAAILLFHPDPEKYVTGAFVKIGFFNEKEILVYQDEIHGYLFEQVEKTMDLLLTKYMNAIISYDGLHRIETYSIPETALREALLNALAHKDYSSGNPIQISVYENKIIFWNEGQLPENWTVARLTMKHPSVPYNPDIARTFFRAGLIEAWGQGIFRIIDDCVNAGIPNPLFQYDLSGFVIHFSLPIDKSFEKKLNTYDETRSDKILAIIRHNKNVTIPFIAKQLAVSVRTVEREMSVLKRENKVIRIGKTKDSSWIVTDF
jgi:ATP-dependent DNA helicase RecG